jgi:hypothetical protein
MRRKSHAERASLRNKEISTKIVRIDYNTGDCRRDCQAEISGWHCYTCQVLVEGHRNTENTLVHVPGDEEHEFCDTCTISVWASPSTNPKGYSFSFSREKIPQLAA